MAPAKSRKRAAAKSKALKKSAAASVLTLAVDGPGIPPDSALAGPIDFGSVIKANVHDSMIATDAPALDQPVGVEFDSETPVAATPANDNPTNGALTPSTTAVINQSFGSELSTTHDPAADVDSTSAIDAPVIDQPVGVESSTRTDPAANLDSLPVGSKPTITTTEEATVVTSHDEESAIDLNPITPSKSKATSSATEEATVVTSHDEESAMNLDPIMSSKSIPPTNDATVIDFHRNESVVLDVEPEPSTDFQRLEFLRKMLRDIIDERDEAKTKADALHKLDPSSTQRLSSLQAQLKSSCKKESECRMEIDGLEREMIENGDVIIVDSQSPMVLNSPTSKRAHRLSAARTRKLYDMRLQQQLELLILSGKLRDHLQEQIDNDESVSYEPGPSRRTASKRDFEDFYSDALANNKRSGELIGELGEKIEEQRKKLKEV